MRSYAMEILLPADRGQYRYEILEDGERIALFREHRHAQVMFNALQTLERKIEENREQSVPRTNATRATGPG